MMREYLRQRGLLVATLGLYFLCGFGLIAQKPGLQYDEAMLVAGGVHMQHSPAVFELENTPKAWICPFDHCIPLMSFLYVGSAKEYANLPFFAIFGGRAPIIRLIALLFGIPLIWGIYRLIDPWFGRKAAALCALIVAINPAFLNMVIFDNGANGGFMAGLGLIFGCISIYATRKSPLWAFALGAAMGFAVWNRANFLYFLVAGGIAAVIVFRRRVLIPVSHGIAVAAGCIVGGFPFILYQIVSGWATWKAQNQFAVSDSIASLLRERAFLFADSILSDGEHRGMWNGPPLPGWQLWFFPSLVLAACLVCLFQRRREEREESGRRSLAQFLTLTFLFAGGILFFSRLPVAEHHLIALVPFAAAISVLACSILQTRFRRAWVASAILLAVYVTSAGYWEIQSILGLRRSGGIGVWSDAGVELASYLDQGFRDREVKILDWGLKYNMYVLSDGRIRAREIYSPDVEDVSFDGRPWIDEIREGGVFLLNGPENRAFPKASEGFLRALSAARPVIHQHVAKQRSGSTYATVIEITPGTTHEAGVADKSPEPRIPMNSAQFDYLLTGFYPPESAGFRWTKREFSARITLSAPYASGSLLLMRVYVPPDAIRKLGSLTLRTDFGGHPLAPETWSSPGAYVLTRELKDAWITGGPIEISFKLDRAMPPTATDLRELGLVVKEISVEPE